MYLPRWRGDQPAIDVVAAAGPVADDQVDLPCPCRNRPPRRRARAATRQHQHGRRCNPEQCHRGLRTAWACRFRAGESAPQRLCLQRRLFVYLGHRRDDRHPTHNTGRTCHKGGYHEAMARRAVRAAEPVRIRAVDIAPEIPFDSVPNFLKLPPDMHLGEASGVAINSKGHIFVYIRGGSSQGPAFAQHGFADPRVRPRRQLTCARSARTSTPGRSPIRCASTRTTTSGPPTRART